MTEQNKAIAWITAISSIPMALFIVIALVKLFA